MDRNESPRTRALPGPLGIVQRALLAAIPVLGFLFILDTHQYLGLVVFTEQYVGAFLSLVLVSSFLGIPATHRATRDRLPWYDALLALAAIPCGLFITAFYPQLALKLGLVTPERVVLGTLAVLLILEALRRATGWTLVALVGLFLLYGRFASAFPGVFRASDTPWERLVNYLYLDPSSMLQLVSIGATMVLAFIFFGQMLYAAGGGKFITDFAMALMGRYRGGPAKMSVISSSLFGTISGSAVANVVVDGVINIPLMKKAGYRPHVSAAVEAVASSGGQIMPPVMGAAAFLIAEFLSIPYAEVALAALVPALLYYLAIFVQIDLEAARQGLRGLPPDQLPRLRHVLGRGWVFFLPLGVLVVTLFSLAWQPQKAALAAALAVLLASFLRAETSLSLARVGRTLEETGRTMLDLGLILAAAGLVVGVVGVSGLGFNLVLALSQLAQSSLLLLLVASAVGSLLLGMGMPTTPAYILVAVLIAPALVKLGVLPLAAHLFILYFATISAITPPVALACFAAAAIAGTDANRVGWSAMRLGVLAYIVPFLFVMSPALLLKDAPASVIASLLTAVAGTVVLGMALVGYFTRPLHPPKRVALALAGLGLLIPFSVQEPGLALVPNVGGGIVAAAALAQEWRSGQAAAIREAAARG